LKLSNNDKLSYEPATTVSFLVVDSDGKPLPAEAALDLRVESADGELHSGGKSGDLTLSIAPGATISPQIQIKPTSKIGGAVHLNTTLLVNDGAVAQESLMLPALPAWWLPLVLAIGGGIIHAGYKISRMAPFSRGGALVILVTSAIAGFVGYLVASFDVFGLKLDPKVLRTYPLIGFLFSYFGIEVLLADKLHLKPAPVPPPADQRPPADH
jgi:hypothetical protein